MKFDYKPKTNQMGSPIFRRTLHVSVGVCAFVCLVTLFSFSAGKPSSSPSPHSLPIDTPSLSVSMASSSREVHSRETPPTPIVTIQSTSSKPKEEVPENWHTIKVRQKDTLSKIFTRLGISTKDIHEIMTFDPASKPLASLQPGQTLKLRVGTEQQITGITLGVAPGNTLHVQRIGEGFKAEHKLVPLEKKIAFGKGEIHSSLFSAGKRAGLDPKILAQMVDIFGWNIDFALDLQPNDTFRVLYEEKFLEGERIQTGRILAAEIVNNGKKHQAIQYTDKSGHTSYFTPDGYGLHQAFLRTPVNFTRISSYFGNRKHPILHHMRHHKGVDYSAPRGTPVQATGDGKVVFLGTRSGYGKVVELQHGARYSTLYAHLSRFPKELRHGVEVKQGQVIGFVGRTGLATGDHLHYEFRIDGIHRDPLTVALPKKSPIPEKHKSHFIAHAKEMLRLLDMHEHKIKMARNEVAY